MSNPSHLKYTKEHEWIELDGKNGIVGVTKFALEQLGDVVYLDLPKVGSEFKSHDTFGTIESTKTVSDLYMPVHCKIIAVNSAIVDAPENLGDDPYKAGWLLKVELLEDPQNLLTAAQYDEYIKNQG
jgi:glycine cleavage system H protein